MFVIEADFHRKSYVYVSYCYEIATIKIWFDYVYVCIVYQLKSQIETLLNQETLMQNTYI